MPSPDLPDLLSENEKTKVFLIYDDHTDKQGVPDPQVVVIAAKKLGCTNEELRVLGFVSNIVDPAKLTPDGLARLLGVVRHGDEATMAEFLFSTIDRDGSGTLDRNELCEVIRLEYMTSSSAVQGALNVVDIADELMRQVDTDHDNLISKEEFVASQALIISKLLYVEQAVM